jgi:tmRNA-binding protein
MAAFFSIPIFNTGCALNGCEVSTLKKNKMNSSFDNIIKSEKPVLIDFLLLGVTLQSAWAYFKRGERQSRRWNFHYKNRCR